MNKKTKSAQSIGDILKKIERKAPLRCSEQWDNVGLLVGNPQEAIRSVVICVDLTDQVIELAQKKKANLIINHHPCIFPRSMGLSKVVESQGSASSRLVHRAIRSGISIAAYHTNFDRCALEVVESVSQGLKIEPRGRLLDRAEESLSKLVTFVPTSHIDQVRAAITEAGAGHIGNYDQCSFSVRGEGNFRGDSKAKPFVGKPGRLEKAQEIRLETVLPSGLEREVLQALRAAHPYEEVAFDLYALKQAPQSIGITSGLGYGFWGEYKAARRFPEVVKDVRKLFNVDSFWLTRPAPSRVKKLAFVAGKGASFVDAALAQGCDLFITGEAGYHVTLDAKRRGMAIIELGHVESERFFLTTMEGWLAENGVKSYSLSDATQMIWTSGEPQ